MTQIASAIIDFNATQADAERVICDRLAYEIATHLPEAEGKIWHAHPVWFLGKNPIVGYSKLKGGVRLMFWSGASFDEPGLTAGTGKFKDASVRYVEVAEIDGGDLARWLEKARRIQWDYGTVVKNRGRLVKVGEW